MELGRALSMVMYLGAARADATPAQLAQLRDAIEPLKAHIKRGEYAHAKLLVREIMGDGWVPGPEWRLADG